MENIEIGKYTRGFGLSFAITSLLSALLVIIKEKNEGTVLAAMAAATGHHWVTHGVINLILFIVLGWLFSRSSEGRGVNLTASALTYCILCGVVINGLLISGFYLLD